ncbi:Putative bifunctional exonuclease/endonuclease protein [Zhongshania aliphaticivorans]|uniref:DNA-directed DNA polymerase n=1 Tax=Zhongshania aliphaticivorans TaxID=1470434 RepID=A0A5S9MMV6_9GAMM|nr:exonuclease domain-containing protein [Zhongshania aliphaticivorans]CAA0078245.1 Putative bifunctional exonuclease/endonuclease protein [Zhongshania aliphaticivorans]CAA0086783.1 Putative bifunctional exonuclease/endonuclease protein [Zhongshania aliphaticivorans]
MLDNVCFALVDLETTGGQASHDQIMEIAVRLVGEGVNDHWESLLDPMCGVPRFIQGLTGITPAMLKGKPTFTDVQNTLWALLDDAVLVAHNARFDAGFLRANFARQGRQYSPRVLCTLKLARTLYPEWPKHGLEAICEQIGFHSEVHHRAMADVDAMKAFFDYARLDKGEAVFNFELGLQLGFPVLPPLMTQSDIDLIPCQPGIYRLLSEIGELLYMDGATSLQEAVLAHFSSCAGDSKATKLARRVGRVEWQLLAGELSVGLRLNPLLRQHVPQMQRRAKTLGKPCSVRFVATTGAVTRLRLRSGLPAKVDLASESFAIFRDRQQAKKCIEEQLRLCDLCMHALNIVSERDQCTCSACEAGDVGTEHSEDAVVKLNSRLLAAFTEYLYIPWPFQEPIVIREDNGNGFVEWHLVNHWCYYGSYYWDSVQEAFCELDKAESGVGDWIGVLAARLKCEQGIDFDYQHYRLFHRNMSRLTCIPLSEMTTIK